MERAQPISRATGVDDLADAELLALRLAAQVLGHKAALADRPLVARYFSDVERVTDVEMARRGVGVVVTPAPALALAPEAQAEDRALLAELLGLLADNEALPPTLRQLAAELLGRPATDTPSQEG